MLPQDETPGNLQQMNTRPLQLCGARVRALKLGTSQRTCRILCLDVSLSFVSRERVDHVTVAYLGVPVIQCLLFRAHEQHNACEPPPPDSSFLLLCCCAQEAYSGACHRRPPSSSHQPETFALEREQARPTESRSPTQSTWLDNSKLTVCFCGMSAHMTATTRQTQRQVKTAVADHIGVLVTCSAVFGTDKHA